MKLIQSHQWYFTFKLLRKITPTLWLVYTSYLLRNTAPTFGTFGLPDIFTITLCLQTVVCCHMKDSNDYIYSSACLS